jgi:hypothetical protein
MDALEGGLGRAAARPGPLRCAVRVPCSRAGFLIGLAGVLVIGLAGVLVVAVPGEVGGTEGGGPDAVEVVLGLAQVQGECLVEEAEAGQGLLQAVDGAGGRLEVAVEVAGGGVVGRPLGEQPPLLALAAPVEQVGAGQDELVAAVAPLTELTSIFQQFIACFR